MEYSLEIKIATLDIRACIRETLGILFTQCILSMSVFAAMVLLCCFLVSNGTF